MGGEIFSNTVADISQSIVNVSVSWTGPFSSLQASTLMIRQLGRLVMLELPGITATGGNAIATATAYGAIPVGLRPLGQIYLPVPIMSNSVYLAANGKVSVDTSGNVVINPDMLGSGLWSALGNAGWQRHCMHWILP
jgi:hypothetical protein